MVNSVKDHVKNAVVAVAPPRNEVVYSSFLIPVMQFPAVAPPRNEEVYSNLLSDLRLEVAVNPPRYEAANSIAERKRLWHLLEMRW